MCVDKSIFLHWFKAIKDLIVADIISLGTKKNSERNIQLHIKELFQIEVSIEYIRKILNKYCETITKPANRFTCSNVLCFDEQFVKIKGTEFIRISAIDSNNPNVYYDKLHENRNYETMLKVCYEIKKQIKKLVAVVVDGCATSKKAFETIFEKIIVQNCLFHYAKNVRKAFKDEVGYGKGKSCLPLEHLIKFFSIINIFFDHDRELIKFKELKKEVDEHIERINRSDFSLEKKKAYIADYNKRYDQKARTYLYNIRKARRRMKGIKLKLRNETEAKQLFEQVKLEHIFPKEVQKQIVRLEKNWMNFTHCLRDHKIPPTSNKVEQFYALTLNWVEKRNLQSEEHFYLQQKFNLFKRYNISLIKKGLFSNFLSITFTLLLVFGPS